MISKHVRDEILSRIRQAETEHGVRVLLAVESGSRGWGFASPNSDYDVRLIYANHPDWYLSITLEEQRDVIEYPISNDIDLIGWDVRKALRLYGKSNPAFVDWIQSPIVYAEFGSFAASVRGLLPQVYSCFTGIQYYRKAAKTNFRGYLEAEAVPMKAYFYTLRPLLNVRWLEKYRLPPPMEFSRLVHLIEDDARLYSEVGGLLGRKKEALETEVTAPIENINAFIRTEFERLENIELPPQGNPDPKELLNNAFRQSLRESWNSHAA